jgi:hypothetical protein
MAESIKHHPSSHTKTVEKSCQRQKQRVWPKGVKQGETYFPPISFWSLGAIKHQARTIT